MYIEPGRCHHSHPDPVGMIDRPFPSAVPFRYHPEAVNVYWWEFRDLERAHGASMGPAYWPRDSSSCKYLATTSGWYLADGMLAVADLRSDVRWNPIRNPSPRPLVMYLANDWSGCLACTACLSGVVTLQR